MIYPLVRYTYYGRHDTVWAAPMDGSIILWFRKKFKLGKELDDRYSKTGSMGGYHINILPSEIDSTLKQIMRVWKKRDKNMKWDINEHYLSKIKIIMRLTK